METIRIMRIEVLHTDLYTGPATEVDFIPCWEDGDMSIFLLETGSRRTDWSHRKARFARHASRHRNPLVVREPFQIGV